jgi:hypothetical protein
MPQVLEANPLANRLSALRRRLRLVVSFRGISWLIAAVVLGVTLAGLLDFWVHLPGLVRAVFLVGILGSAGIIAYRYLIHPFRTRTDDLSLALRVEAEYPELNDSLASTVQFLDEPDDVDRSGSSALRRAAVKRALYQAGGCDFGRVIDRRGLKSAGMAALAVSALAVWLVVLQPAVATTALARLADPFGATEWPPLTLLVDHTNRLRIAQGEAFDIRATLEGIVPENATVTYRFSNDPTPLVQTYPVLRKDDSPVGTLAARLSTLRIAGSFRYQIKANDGATPWREVQVLPPVRLVQLDGRPSPQIRLRFPEYTEFPPRSLPDGSANIEAVTGTHVALRAAVDRPLSAASVELRPDQPGLSVASFLGPLGASLPVQAAVMNAARQQIWERIPARLEQNGLVLSVDFLPRLSGTYALRLEDQTGLVTNRLFDVRLLEDPTPQVNLERPSASLDSLAVLPHAEVTVQVLADDAQCPPGVPSAVRAVYLQYRTQKDETPRRLMLYDHRAAEAVVPRLGLALARAPVAPGSPSLFRSRPPRLQIVHRLPLKQLRHPDGSELREGDALVLVACAVDFDNVAVEKQPGRSHEVELHIVGRQTLEAALHQAQARVQQELLRLRERQNEALAKVDAAEKQWRNTGKLRPEDLENLLQAGEMQKEIRGRIGTSQEGLRAEVNRVLQTLRDNRLPRSGTHERMEMVAGELERLAAEELEPIEPLLTNARKENELAAERPKPEKGKPGALSEALGHQEEVEKTLAELLARLEPWSTTREVKGEARAILEEERKLASQTDKLGRELPLGQDPKDLTPEQRAELERAAEAQARVAEHAGQLLNKMERVAQEKRRLAEEKTRLAKEKEKQAKAARDQARQALGTNIEKAQRLTEEAEALSRERERLEEEAKALKAEAAALEDAAQQGRERELGDKLKRAANEVGQNKLSNAAGDQKAGMDALEKVVKALEDRREEELDQLIKNLRDAEKELARLREEQDALQKKVKEAEQIEDPAKRKEELQKLSRRQDELRKKTQDMLRELSRLRADRARDALSRAGNEMDDAGQKLERGDKAQDEQEEALDRLDEAREEIRQARKDAEDELAREKLLKIADQLRMIKERHEALIPRVADVHKETLERKSFGRNLQGRLVDLADAEKGIGQEAAGLAEEKLKGATVFARLLGKAAGLMNDAAIDMGQRAQKPLDDPKTGLDVKAAEAADRQTQDLMGDALVILNQMLDALKPENAVARRPQQQGGGNPMGQDGPKAQGDGIPYLAQLKALKALQENINRRTADFARKHPDTSKLTKEEQQELAGLRQEQDEVKDLLEELTAPEAEGGKP